MRFVGAMCPREVVVKFVSAAVVLNDVAHLRRMIFDLEGAEDAGIVQRVRNGDFDKLCVGGGKYEFRFSRSRSLDARGNEYGGPCRRSEERRVGKECRSRW